MQALNKIVDELTTCYPDGEILIETGGSPSGKYHLGHLRELVTADAIMLELRRRGRQSKHIYFVDDLDAFRKVPANVPSDYEQYLGVPLCDIPAPDGSKLTYAEYCLENLITACEVLGIEVEFMRSHQKYRSGFFVPAIERSLERVDKARQALETISGRKLDEHWTPIQIMEKGRLKNRPFRSIDTTAKTVTYTDVNGDEQSVNYEKGEVKLDWRLDWPGRWWLLKVLCEPSGQDHTTKGGSVDTGVQIMKDVYEADPPLSVAYEFINLVGDTKKMSASKGTGLDAAEGSRVMPPEVLRYFILRAAPSRRLYFDPINGVIQLMDEYAAFAAKPDKTESDEQLLYLCTRGLDHKTVSRVPFSHLVASYQAALRDPAKTLAVISRTEHADVVEEESEIIHAELRFIDEWLERWAPEEAKFTLQETVSGAYTEQQKAFMTQLADKIASAPKDADGSWFHEAIYSFKDSSGLAPKELFTTLYQVTIGKDSGPRAGWFLSMLPRDWLISRLRLVA